MKTKIEAIIFDLGGTLIDYEGFPHYWGDYYHQAFKYVSDQLTLNVSEEQINAATETLKKYNPRLYPREMEYTPAAIFSDVFDGWNLAENRFDTAIAVFFAFFQQNVMVYPETVPVINELKANGYKIGILTDVPTGMPTEIIIQDIRTFKDKIDYFLSSIDCGFRKPNKRGIEIIAEHFGVQVQHIAFVGNEEKTLKQRKTLEPYRSLSIEKQ
ncbi:HAD family hydrolase [Paenibacillus rhizovicinus]|uniref:HAD family hydrolase n=1 Tax=Paenibacillus rhizovicinus TaxID=2704463 RepID=A0A6C0NYL1_9BACL|nr:HAD family hydrolase [Paenibacillus rhizovicinus]QHW31298.1 HAD family hydrolase [Paenibacillus rhizovicinus]